MGRQLFGVRAAMKIAGASVVAAVVTAGMVVPAGMALAAPAAQPEVAAAADAVWEHTAELQELRTSDNRGTFYTLNEEEADKAESVHGFRRTGEAAGIRMFTKEVPGSIPVHRLKRVNVPYHTYIVSSNEQEIEDLTSEKQPGLKFKDEGVLGYVLVEQKAGTMPLYRYAKETVWRVARDNRVDLLLAGYKKSKGVIGFVPRG
ncbi:hypothetical protein WEH80_33725 [Actinomycetes bacterium KLBMP 9759]